MQSAGSMQIGGIVRLVKRIALGTLLFEGAGAIALSFRFCPEMGAAEGLYNAVFHSISAFCNAGFDLMGEKGSVFFPDHLRGRSARQYHHHAADCDRRARLYRLGRYLYLPVPLPKVHRPFQDGARMMTGSLILAGAVSCFFGRRAQLPGNASWANGSSPPFPVGDRTYSRL